MIMKASHYFCMFWNCMREEAVLEISDPSCCLIDPISTLVLPYLFSHYLFMESIQA